MGGWIDVFGKVRESVVKCSTISIRVEMYSPVSLTILMVENIREKEDSDGVR